MKSPQAAPDAATGTREMPQFLAAGRGAPAPAPRRVPRRWHATERKPKPSPKPAAKKALAAADKNASADAAREQVIGDAARLVQWGRKWYELPELIARMADRPALPEVRRILKENKAAIDKKAGVG